MLNEVKGYLKVTWDDEDEDIARLIAQGEAALEELAGAELDFQSESLARSLLFDYVRYAYNNASEYFEENFAKQILRLQIMTSVAQLPEDDPDETQN
ncbi:MAG TPA: head-tail connector protein [Bacillota bacterium]|nr:head-tail connector protein [Bacillota bacterium]